MYCKSHNPEETTQGGDGDAEGLRAVAAAVNLRQLFRAVHAFDNRHRDGCLPPDCAGRQVSASHPRHTCERSQARARGRRQTDRQTERHIHAHRNNITRLVAVSRPGETAERIALGRGCDACWGRNMYPHSQCRSTVRSTSFVFLKPLSCTPGTPQDIGSAWPPSCQHMHSHRIAKQAPHFRQG